MVEAPVTASLACDAVGLGLRPAFYPHVREKLPDIDYFEVITENFLGSARPPKENLQMVARHYPVVLHGVGLNLLSASPLNENYLDAVCRLADRVNAPFVSDHLCWTGSHGFNHHDLLPTPYTHDLIGFAAERADQVKRRLDRPFALENLSSYVCFHSSEMPEWEFYRAVVLEADIHFLLDINNVYVSSQNHGFDPYEYVQRIPKERVLQMHLAGHDRRTNGSIIDTHDRPVSKAVWELYRSAWQNGFCCPTLLEWDEHIPTFSDVRRELGRIREVRP